MGRKNNVEIEGEIVQEREKAIAFTDGTEEPDPRNDGAMRLKWFWLPRSQISIQFTKGKQCIVTMPEWLAKDKGLI